jgi:hypothetical protein
MTLEAKRASLMHLPEEALEKYAFGRLPHDQLPAFEEHLLCCEHCQRRLNAEDMFAEAMRILAETEDRAVATAYRPPRSSAPAPAGRLIRIISTVWSGFGRTPVWATVMAAILIAGVVVWLPVRQGASGGPEAVVLTTFRGAGGAAEVKAGRPLDLSIDVSSFLDAQAEPGPYRVEVVNAAGFPVWTATASPSAEKISARLERSLAAGIYWVRLYAPSGMLLREFGLHVE